MQEPTSTTPDNPFEDLTPRELEVARALALGAKNSQIAENMKISVKTVDTHRSHILGKLGIHGNVALARMAIRFGIVSLDEA